jgi:hypothetical protein
VDINIVSRRGIQLDGAGFKPRIRSSGARRRIYSDKHHMLYWELVISWKMKYCGTSTLPLTSIQRLSWGSQSRSTRDRASLDKHRKTPCCRKEEAVPSVTYSSGLADEILLRLPGKSSVVVQCHRWMQRSARKHQAQSKYVEVCAKTHALPAAARRRARRRRAQRIQTDGTG